MRPKRGKASRYGGTCVKCKKPVNGGERVVFLEMAHESCFHGQFAAIPPAPTLEYTRLRAMDALEEFVQVAAKVNGVSDALEKEWDRYEKLKEMALRPGSKQEERQAFKMATVGLVKMVYGD